MRIDGLSHQLSHIQQQSFSTQKVIHHHENTNNDSFGNRYNLIIKAQDISASENVKWHFDKTWGQNLYSELTGLTRESWMKKTTFSSIRESRFSNIKNLYEEKTFKPNRSYEKLMSNENKILCDLIPRKNKKNLETFFLVRKEF